jgi:hypothetical protein
LHSSSVLSVTSVKGMQDEDIASKLAQFRTRYAPSARLSSWNSSQTQSTSSTPPNDTGSHSAPC